MSVRTSDRVWKHSKHGGTELLMLLAIADFADDQGNAYPAVSTLAAKCRMKPRNATYILRALEASGELQICVNGGPKGANRYRIVAGLEGVQQGAGGGVQQGAGVQPIAGVQSNVTAPATECTPPAIHGSEPLQPIAPEPSGNRQLNVKEPSEKKRASAPSLSQVSRPDDVEEQVWNDYLKVRKAKKAGALTQTAIEGIAREAVKASVSLESALRVCCERSWIGFKADWHANTNRGPNPSAPRPQPTEPDWRREQRERMQQAAPYAAVGRMSQGSELFAGDDWDASRVTAKTGATDVIEMAPPRLVRPDSQRGFSERNYREEPDGSIPD